MNIRDINRTIFNAKLKINNKSYPKVISGLKLNIGWNWVAMF